MPAQTHLRIIGMNCGACAQRVEQALGRVPGVADVSVNLLRETASVVVQERDTPHERLLAAVRNAGYDAELMPTDGELAAELSSDAEHQRHLRRHRQAVVQALGLAVPIVALEYLRHLLWGPGFEQQIACRLLQIVLLIMLAASHAGAPILAGGLRALWHRTGNMDLLITLGVVVAFAGSLYALFVARDNSFVHLHAAAMILALVNVGRYLEAGAKGRASAAMSALARRATQTALVRRNGELVSIPVEQVKAGDLISIPPHAAIPTDGEVVEGTATVDESLMTGEAMPVERSRGDGVFGGTVVTEGMLLIRATTVGSRSALGRIVQLVARAQAGHTPMQRMADRIAAVFTPVVIAVAAAAFVGWLVVAGQAGLPQAVRAAIAVLVVACPCALGLATPTVVLVASGLAALRGILVRDAGTLEAAGQVDVVVWDKTGTLTAGMPTVRSIKTVEGFNAQRMMHLAAAAERFSEHPLAKAIIAHAKREGIELCEPANFESVPGGGVAATVNGKQVLAGGLRFLRSRGVNVAALEHMADEARDQDATLVGLAVDGAAAGLVTFADALRPSSKEAVRRLRDLGIESEILTGDGQTVARAVGRQVGIDDISAQVDPAGKVERIEALRRAGRRVAMVGDGVNDAAALAAADVGIAFATGADVAGEAAGINLIGSTPHLVADAVVLARASLRIIRQNLFWAFFYNVLMIPLAAAGKLPPALAAGAMMVSSLTVVLNALRLPRAVGWPHGARDS